LSEHMFTQYVYNEQHISKIRLKVQTRLSQIKNQIDHFQFIGYTVL